MLSWQWQKLHKIVHQLSRHHTHQMLTSSKMVPFKGNQYSKLIQTIFLIRIRQAFPNDPIKVYRVVAVQVFQLMPTLICVDIKIKWLASICLKRSIRIIMVLIRPQVSSGPSISKLRPPSNPLLCNGLLLPLTASTPRVITWQ